ncbi:MAG: hypothetical protein AB7O28_05490 [Vicinamibacterales bacterium]
MTETPSRCTEYTRIAGWLSVLFIAATYLFLRDAYDRLPLLLPVLFDDGNPLQFAFKTPAFVYLPVVLQLALGLVFLSVVALLVRRSRRAGGEHVLPDAAAVHAAEGIALLAMVWIAFQGANAWRLVSLYGRTFDADIEMYALALITAITATIVIAARAILKVREYEADGSSHAALPVVDGRGRLASAALAAALGVGIAVPFYLAAAIWGGLHHI